MLVVGLALGVAAGACWATSATLHDERTILDEATAIAKSEPVREEFGWQIAEAIAPHSATTAPTELNLANAVAAKVVDSPEFQQAIAVALPAMYAQVVDDAPGDVVLDPGLVNRAFVSVGAPAPSDLRLVARRDKMPELRGSIQVISTAAPVLGASAAILILWALAITTRRVRAVSRIGRWLITTGLVTVVVFWALPSLALVPLGGWIGVVGIVLATADWLLLPAAVLAGVGIAIVVIGNAGEAEHRRQELSTIPTKIGRVPNRASTR